MKKARTEALKPPPQLSLSEWANTYGVIPKGASADAGKFYSFKYQDGIMDSITDPTVSKITVMKSARVGYTRILDHMVGYYIHQDPSPILFVQPTIEDARNFSETEIEPMLLETPELKEIVGDIKSRAAKQKVDYRQFRNGASIKFIGAESPNGFRRVTVRIVAFDEVDGYTPMGAGDEGDQITLGEKRAETYWDSKVILGSTPVTKGASRIEKSFETSDQRFYNVVCPHCDAKQVLKWENLKWDKAEDGTHLPETAHFRCEALGCRIEEHDKLSMINGGEWIATAPFKGHAGFHIWSAYSLHPKATWSSLAKKWLEVYKNPVQRKPFYNLELGLPYKDAVELSDPGTLKARCEPYSWQDLPEDVQFTTAGVDTQDDRIEVTFVGWGAGEESWIARHEVLYGDVSKPYVWDELDTLLATPCETNDMRRLSVQAVVIDSAGHNSEMVYKFCRDRRRRRVYAGIGRGNSDQKSPRMIWPKTASRTKNSGDKPFIIGVDTAKDDLSSRLTIVPDENNSTPRSVHFPAIGLSADYFEQLTSEHAITYRVGNSFKRKWDVKTEGRRNETWDCLVYALAARLSLPKKLDKPARRPPREPKPDDVTDVVVANDNEPAPPEKEKPKKRQRERWGAYR